MDYKQRSLLILLASSITAGFDYIFILLTNHITPALIGFSNYYRYGILLYLFTSMLIGMAAGLPVLSIKNIRKVPYMISITLFATAESFALSYLLTVPAVLLLGWWVVFPLKAVLVIAMYFAGDALFNRWNGQRRNKTITAVGIVMLTLILAEGTRVLLSKIMM